MARRQGLAQQGQGRALTRPPAARRARWRGGPLAGPALAALLAAAFPARAQEPAAAPRPDLVLLVADDLGTALPSSWGGPVATPALDRLAAGGVAFDAAYATAPNCTPSRASLLTGLYPSAHGAVGYGPIRAGVPTVPGLLASAGYRCVALGKLGVEAPAPAQLPFEHAPAPGEPAALADAVAAALAGDTPALVWVGLREPHRPFPDPPVARGGEDELPVPGYLFDTPETRAELRGYAAAIRRLDARVDAVLDALDARAKDDARPAVVVLLSDNGPPFPFAKATLYEAGIRVPLIVRWPGVARPGERRAALVSLVDLAPTLLEAAGVAGPDGLHGRSLARLLDGSTDEHRDVLLATVEEVYAGPPLPARSLRAGRWKYLRHLEPGRPYTTAATHTATFRSWIGAFGAHPELEARCRRFVERQEEQLHDLAADPFELRDRSTDPAAQEALADMRARLDATLAALGDPRAPAEPTAGSGGTDGDR